MTFEWRRWSGVHSRLTLSYVAAMLVVLGIYAAGVFTVVRRSASSALDTQIRADFMWATEMWEEEPDGRLSWFDGHGAIEDEDRPWLRVWTPNGELLAQTAMAQRNPLPDSASLATEPSGSIRTADSAGLPFRVLTRSVTVGDRPVIIQVARSEAPMRRELYQLVLVFVLGLPLAVAAAALGGYALARRALAPVGRMAERARAITATRLSERLPVDDANDELGKLALVFNRTLERLENSFEQMRRFTGDVSHQLRTPLTALRTVGEVALRDHRSKEEYRATIGSMLEDADRLRSLVDRLLTLSRASSAESTEAVPMDLSSLAEEVAAHLRVLADERTQTIEVRRETNAPCLADPVLIRQAAINLVDNALKYSPNGSRVVLTVRAAEEAGVPCVRLDVTDQGPGIAAGDVNRIFQRFYHGAAPAGTRSHGLGLAIAKAVAEANQGRLTSRSTPGEGSTFSLILPQAPIVVPPADQVHSSRPASAPLPHRRTAASA
ncbi:MAG: HAMP domain-containing protein [Acidimicrobiia bacterium]|nr:HAMP domain-containing protein [Acidimicrobiia bacterium]